MVTPPVRVPHMTPERRDAYLAYQREWRHVGAVSERNAEYFRRVRKQALKDRQEAAMGRPRPDKCEVCSGTDSHLGVVFDHCHVSGKARGWLCAKCNSALGLVNDDPQGLRALAAYLEAFARSASGTAE